MNEQTGTALFNLLAFAQGKEADASRREYDAKPGEVGGVDAYFEAIHWRNRKDYLVSFIQTKIQ